MTRTTPVGASVRTSDVSDMETTKTSIQHHGSEMKGRNHVERASTPSSKVKMIVKKKFRWSRRSLKLVGDPSGLVRLLANCASKMVQVKLCGRVV